MVYTEILQRFKDYSVLHHVTFLSVPVPSWTLQLRNGSCYSMSNMAIPRPQATRNIDTVLV